MSIEAMKAIQMVYANTTKHDWPDDIWDAICQAIKAEKHEVSQEPVTCKEDDVGNLEYRGNSVGYIFQKMTAYKKGIVDVWDALKSIGVHPDGKTSAPDAIRNLYIHPQPKREPLTIEQLLEHWRVAKVLDMTDAEIDFADYVLIARDVEALYGITSDMKQEHGYKTAKQRHEENT